LDPSPKLPSQLVANYIMQQFITSNDDTINLILIREKLSKLSSEVNFKSSIFMNLAYTSATPEDPSGIKFIEHPMKEVTIELKR
jgi:hypothetical protein